jgi:hypothetical protein
MPVRLSPKVKNFPHYLFGSFERHRHALKDVSHHLSVTQNALMHDWNVLIGRGAQDQARRRQNDARLCVRDWRGFLVHRHRIPRFST